MLCLCLLVPAECLFTLQFVAAAGEFAQLQTVVKYAAPKLPFITDPPNCALPAADMEGEAAEAVGEYKVLSRGTLGLKSGTISLNDVSLPDRSADGVDVFALNHVKL